MRRPPFGYTSREWGFLQLAATWSGYFVPRQFATFGGASPGAVTHALTEKLIRQRHATVTTHARNAHLYHLSARPLYAALGQGDNRNRRQRPAHQVRVKLMALDFVLERKGLHLLTTEDEKVTHLKALGATGEVLPHRRYQGKGGAATTRYFLDKFPLFVCSGQVGFTFISGDTPSLASFRNFLDEYWPLFTALRSVALQFVTSRPELAAVAERELRRYAEQRQASAASSSLTDFFALRARHEGRGPELSMAELRTLRAGLQTYRTPHHETLFRAWSAGARTALCSPATGPQIRLEAAVLPHHYDLFGDV